MFLHKKNHSSTETWYHSLSVKIERRPDTNGYRPISLLTREYKLLARITARRLRHVLKDHLHTSQFCGVPGNSIMEAASIVREVIAYSETLDFQHAFDRISHHYIFKILH